MRFAVLGDPIAHSKSPAMHRAAYAARGLAHTYEAIRATAEDLPGVVADLRAGKLDGVNVTVPHKRRVLDHVDAVDASASLAGAANTLVRGADGRVTAHNTDAPALAIELARLAEGAWSARSWGDARALVLGTGGAARAAILALSSHLGVAEVVVSGRSFDREPARAAFQRDMDAMWAASGARARLHLAPWGGEVPGAQLQVIVQASSAGMEGADAGETAADAVPWDRVAPSAIALDVVYAPRDTPFLRAARARGGRADNGLGMLARQGALAFELWLGVAAPFEIMLAAAG